MSVFPGIEVRGIETFESVVGTDTGMALRPEGELASAEDIIPEEIKTLLLESEKDKLLYDLRVDAVNKRAALAKGRTFVRAKNPFEPGVVTNTGPIKMLDEGTVRDTYHVSLGVEK